jgi:hypothetical protein
MRRQTQADTALNQPKPQLLIDRGPNERRSTLSAWFRPAFAEGSLAETVLLFGLLIGWPVMPACASSEVLSRAEGLERRDPDRTAVRARPGDVASPPALNSPRR